MPQDDRWIAAFFWVFLGCALLLTVGLWTRVMSVAVFLCLNSIDQRNLLILHGGDTFLRCAGFFLMFAPAGAAFSLDRLIAIRRGKQGPQIKPRAPWAQRMIQIELSLLYLTSFFWKLKGHNMAEWKRALLRDPFAFDRAVPAATLDPIHRNTESRQLVYAGPGVFARCADLVAAISLSPSALGSAVPFDALNTHSTSPCLNGMSSLLIYSLSIRRIWIGGGAPSANAWESTLNSFNENRLRR